MKESAPESAGDAFALLFPGLPAGLRARLVSEWAREDVRPAYVRRGLTPPAWVEQGGMDPDEFRLLRYAERIRAVGSTEEELCVLRAAVVRRSTETSQEKLAKAIGVNPATLHHFRRGRVPNRITLARLERWYREAVIDGDLELASEPGAVLVLKPWLVAVPCSERGAAAAELIRGMRGWHLTRGLPVPSWMDAEIHWSAGHACTDF